MKRNHNKIISFLLAILMMLEVVLPATSFAQEGDDINYDIGLSDKPAGPYTVEVKVTDGEGNPAQPKLNGYIYHLYLKLNVEIIEDGQSRHEDVYYLSANPIQFRENSTTYISNPITSSDFRTADGISVSGFDFATSHVVAVGLVEVLDESEPIIANAVFNDTALGYDGSLYEYIKLNDQMGYLSFKSISFDPVNHISPVLELEMHNYEPQRDASSFIGEAAEYGIIAGTYNQEGHTETNFAVKHYSNKDQAIEVMGSGNAAVPFYVGEIINTQNGQAPSRNYNRIRLDQDNFLLLICLQQKQ